MLGRHAEQTVKIVVIPTLSAGNAKGSGPSSFLVLESSDFQTLQISSDRSFKSDTWSAAMCDVFGTPHVNELRVRIAAIGQSQMAGPSVIRLAQLA
jgi:hypothetical protein